MSDGTKAAIGILALIALVVFGMKLMNRKAVECEADGGVWTKNPGSAASGFHCEMPK